MWRFINAHRHYHKVPVVPRNFYVGITRRFEQVPLLNSPCGTERRRSPLGDYPSRALLVSNYFCLFFSNFRSRQDLSMTENCNAENLSTNLANEIRYRWWPPVEHRPIPPTSQAGTGDLTFEALSRNLARKWFPVQSTSITTTSTASDGTICSSKPEGTSSEEYQGDSDPTPAGKGHPSSKGCALNPEPPQVRVQHNGSPTSTAESQLLFLARHGETDMNAAGKLQGRGVDAQLNSFGDRQATELGRFLRNVPFDTVTSSSLRRAFEV